MREVGLLLETLLPLNVYLLLQSVTVLLLCVVMQLYYRLDEVVEEHVDVLPTFEGSFKLLHSLVQGFYFGTLFLKLRNHISGFVCEVNPRWLLDEFRRLLKHTHRA